MHTKYTHTNNFATKQYEGGYKSLDEMNRGIRVLKMLKQVMDAIKNKMQQEFKEMNLTGTQGMVMGVLIHNKNLKISDLSEQLGLSNSTVSGIVDRMEKHGIIERTRSKEDRRVVHVNVTSEFRKKAKNHFNTIEKKFEDILSEATPEEVSKVLEGIEILNRLISKQEE